MLYQILFIVCLFIIYTEFNELKVGGVPMEYFLNFRVPYLPLNGHICHSINLGKRNNVYGAQRL